MNSSEVHTYLNSFNNFESQLHQLRSEDFNLHRIHKFSDLLGNPAKNLKIIHVAGTKGKGSTCAFLASILQEAGYTVGLYSSPHLFKVNERIRILDKKNLHSKDNFFGSISDDELAIVMTSLRPVAASILNEGSILTYFEVLTMAALCHFARAKVDVVILETGLGGRLDATNAFDSLVAVITPISLDHTRILGDTLSKIAFEKACIIKNSHQKVVIAPQEKQAMGIILNRCREFGVQPVIVSPEKAKNLKIGLKGKHQVINAATAMEAASMLRLKAFNIDDQAISEGINNVRWPGRFEILKKNPSIVVDCAHNGASAQALAETLKEEYSHRRVILILGISQDKDIAAICGHLKDVAADVFLTKAQHPRSHVFIQAEAENFFAGKSFEIIESLPLAMAKAMKTASAEDIIVVTGSIFVVAEAASILNAMKEI